jgi:hypothetical protein
MPEISVRLSRKGGDAAKAQKARKPDADRVAGQERAMSVVCWNCWAVNEVVWSATGDPLNYICWNCGISGTI